MRNESIVVAHAAGVPFPKFTSERVYMRPFTQRDGLPEYLQRWQPTVDAMLQNIDAPGPIYIMIDQTDVPPGRSQRRPGLHIDGYWNASAGVHDDGGGSHGGKRISSTGGWHGGRKRIAGSSWGENCDFSALEALVLASDVEGSRAFVGEWHGYPATGGDCSHIDTAGMEIVPMRAGVTYAGNVTALHESLPLMRGGPRTLVRLNIPGWSPR